MLSSGERKVFSAIWEQMLLCATSEPCQATSPQVSDLVILSRAVALSNNIMKADFVQTHRICESEHVQLHGFRSQSSM